MSDDIHDWRRDGEDGLEAAKQEFEPRRESEVEPEHKPEPLTHAMPAATRPSYEATRPGPAGLVPQAIACSNCGYNLTGATIGMACPECGMIVGSGLLGANSLPTSGKAIASLVLGLFSSVGCLFFFFLYGLPAMICGPLAIIFARLAKRQVQRGEVNPSSAGLATAGFVCGLIGTTMGGIVLLFVLGMIGVAIFTSP